MNACLTASFQSVDLLLNRTRLKRTDLVLLFLFVTGVCCVGSTSREASLSSGPLSGKVALPDTSPFHNDTTSTTLQDIPVDIIAQQIISSSTSQNLSGNTHPWVDNNALSTKDISALFSASKYLHSTKAHLDPVRTFYYSVAYPHFNLGRNDSPLRFSQAFYECARLSARARIAIAPLLNHRNVESDTANGNYSLVEYITFCASNMLELVASPFTTQATDIPPAFLAGLVYKTMNVLGAYERLMPLFNFQSSVVAITLSYHNQCINMLRLIKSHHAGNASLIVVMQPWYDQSSSVFSGCLLWIRTFKLPHTRRFVSRQRLKYRLQHLQNHWSDAYHDYLRMLDDFKETLEPFLPSRIEQFVRHEGLLISIVIRPVLENMRQNPVLGTYILTLLTSQFGLDINMDLEVKRATSLATIDMLSYILSIHLEYKATLMRHPTQEMVVDIVKAGADLNLRNENGANLLGFYLSEYHNFDMHLDARDVVFLIQSGSNLDRLDNYGWAPIDYLLNFARETKTGFMYFLPVAIERVRPNRKSASGDPLIFDLLRIIDNRISGRYVWQLIGHGIRRGLYLNVCNSRGQSPAQVLRSKKIKSLIPMVIWLEEMAKAQPIPPQGCAIYRDDRWTSWFGRSLACSPWMSCFTSKEPSDTYLS